MENFVNIASARGGGGWQKCQLTKCKEKGDKMRKKTSFKSKQIQDLNENLMYLNNDFVSKEAFSKENSQMGLRQFLSSLVRKILSKGGKNSCVRHFFVVF